MSYRYLIPVNGDGGDLVKDGDNPDLVEVIVWIVTINCGLRFITTNFNIYFYFQSITHDKNRLYLYSIIETVATHGVSEHIHLEVQINEKHNFYHMYSNGTYPD